ncbi:MAG: hypothetical protein LBD22_06795 [Spirochaetaceae bacterium]|jgi:hypothetical protein|nr:hypothetical protein [Spirochaetaceae bacterium]
MKQQQLTAAFTGLAIAVITGAAGLLFFHFVEFYQVNVRQPPAEQVKRNLYQAVEQWLEVEGHPVYRVSQGSARDVCNRPSHVALVFSSSFDWSDGDILEECVRSGLALVIFIDDTERNDLRHFLARFDINYQLIDETIDVDDVEDAAEMVTEIPENGPSVDYDKEIVLGITGDENDLVFEVLCDASGTARMVKTTLEKGLLVVTGIPFFMQWKHLIREGANVEQAALNSKTAWNLSGALDTDNKGIIMVCSPAAAAKERHDDVSLSLWVEEWQNMRASLMLFGSLCAFVVIGLWMNSAPFGTHRYERVLPGKTITARFGMEARFLKKHRALHKYLEPWSDALRVHFRYLGILDDNEICRYLTAKFNLDAETAALLLTPAPLRSSRDLLRYRTLYQQILAVKAPEPVPPKGTLH